MEHKVTMILIVIGGFSTVNKGLVQGLKELEIITGVEIIQNSKKCPGDMLSLKLQ